jgi:hypothetical protein
MAILPRIGIPVIGVAIVAAGLVAASPQANATSIFTFGVPSDCSVTTGPPYTTVQMTCTDRPGTQVWQLAADCTFGPQGADVDVTGSVVTGDGTSSLHCPVNTNEVQASFQVDS